MKFCLESTEEALSQEIFIVRWMELESVIQSEVSQKEKNKYSMLTHIYGIKEKKKKKVMKNLMARWE